MPPTSTPPSSSCIIVPCYNEADRLPIDSFLTHLQQVPTAQFCFVDDGSTDHTRTLLEALQQQHPGRIDALILPTNSGKAEAVRAGMVHCASKPVDYLGFLDADLATPPDAMVDLATVLDQHPTVDLVMGSRIQYLGTDIRRSTFRHYSGRVVATFISFILKIPVYDTQCGAKLFRRTCVSSLFREPFISRWLFDVELLARLIRQYGPSEVLHHIREQPLRQWTEKGGSRIRPSYYLKLWFDLYRIHQAYRNN